AQHEALDGVTDIELHARLLVPAVVDAFQEVIEKVFLQIESIAAREHRPVRVAVDFEPFLHIVGSLDKAVEVAAWMDTLPAPVGTSEKRRAYARKIRRARTMPVVVKRLLLQFLERVHAVF